MKKLMTNSLVSLTVVPVVVVLAAGGFDALGCREVVCNGLAGLVGLVTWAAVMGR